MDNFEVIELPVQADNKTIFGVMYLPNETRTGSVRITKAAMPMRANSLAVATRSTASISVASRAPKQMERSEP